MLLSAITVVSALSLFSAARAATITARGDDCSWVCPDKDVDGNPFYGFTIGDKTLTCSYGWDSKPCAYDSVSGGYLWGNNCPKNAIKKSTTWKGRELKQAMVRRDDGHGGDGWNNDGHGNDGWPNNDGSDHGWPRPSPRPGWNRKRDEPYPTSSYTPSPYGSSTPPKPKPSTKPCPFRCPQKDLAKNPLTDEAIRGPWLFCSFYTPKCDTCDFCKYDTKTGKLLEDNDDGNCPPTADATLPWERRSD